MSKLRFSGHDTFIVRTFWPKKGYDFIINGGNFNAEYAVKLLLNEFPLKKKYTDILFLKNLYEQRHIL